MCVYTHKHTNHHHNRTTKTHNCANRISENSPCSVFMTMKTEPEQFIMNNFLEIIYIMPTCNNGNQNCCLPHGLQQPQTCNLKIREKLVTGL